MSQSNLRRDIGTDLLGVCGDLTRAIVKVMIAAWVLRAVGHVDKDVAFSTAALLGATDFFTSKRKLKCVEDMKVRVWKRADGSEYVESEEHKQTGD